MKNLLEIIVPLAALFVSILVFLIYRKQANIQIPVK